MNPSVIGPGSPTRKRRAYVHKLLAKGNDLTVEQRQDIAWDYGCTEQSVYWDVLYYRAAEDDEALRAIVRRACSSHRQRAKRYNVENTLTLPEAIELIRGAEGRCSHCGQDIGRQYLVLDHIVPMFAGGANSTDNLRVVCYECNNRKAGLEKHKLLKTIKIDASAQELRIIKKLTTRQRTEALLDAAAVQRMKGEDDGRLLCNR